MALPQPVTDSFAPAPGCLNAPRMGLPPRAVVVAVEVVPFAAPPGAVDAATDLVVFSLAQSATGALVELDGVRGVAQRCGARPT